MVLDDARGCLGLRQELPAWCTMLSVRQTRGWCTILRLGQARVSSIDRRGVVSVDSEPWRRLRTIGPWTS